jgi:uncharacterized protein (DUF433 family)
VSGEHHARREVHRVLGMHRHGFSERKIAKRCGLTIEAVRAMIVGKRRRAA